MNIPDELYHVIYAVDKIRADNAADSISIYACGGYVRATVTDFEGVTSTYTESEPDDDDAEVS